jgi:hypothetical protein
MPFVRTRAIPGTGTSASNPRRQVNDQTGWLDGSVIYGTSAERLAELRRFVGGELLYDDINGVPRNWKCLPMAGHGNPCLKRLAGDERANVAPGILSLHGLFVLEHNRWARELAKANPSWNDETLFQEARKRVIAELQAITYREYATALLGNPLPTYTAYNASLDPRIDPSFAIAAYRYGHSGIDSTYWCITKSGDVCSGGNLLLREVYFDPSYLDDGATISNLIRGMVMHPEGNIDTSMVADLRNHVEGMMSDLAARDIMRGRDFGLPSFVQARRNLGMSVPTSWADVTEDPRVQARLKAAYNDDLSQLDLWVGGLAESGSSGSFIGPTFKAIIRDQFLRLRDGDPFYFGNKELGTTLADGTFKRYFTDAEIDELSRTSLSAIIKANTDYLEAPNSVFRTVDPYWKSLVAVDGTVVDGGITGSSPPQSTSGSIAPTPQSGNSSTNGTWVTPPKRATINSLIALDWNAPTSSDTTIEITFTLKGTGYLGFGLGKGMSAADVWLMQYSGGSGTVTDRWSSGYFSPVTDATNDLTLVSSSQTGGTTKWTVKRAINTGASGDIAFGAGQVDVIFAWDPSNPSMGFHGSNYVMTKVDFLTRPAAVWVAGDGSGGGLTIGPQESMGADPEEEARKARFSAYGFHGLTMFSVWGFLVPIGIFFIRFLKHKPMHLAFHKWSMLTATTLTLPAAGSALVQVSRASTVAHAYVGISLSVLVAVQVVIGVLVRNWLRSEKQPPQSWKYYKWFHRHIGWLMMFAGFSNIVLGIGFLFTTWVQYFMVCTA